jgi:hypothetical protein
MHKEEIQGLFQQSIQQIGSTSSTILNWTRLIEASREMRAPEEAQITHHFDRAFADILDPNVFSTLRDPQGHKKILEINGYVLEVVVTHRALGLENIMGVDVFYNLMDWKALAFQHKKRGKDGTFAFGKEEREQRDKIMALCRSCKLSRRLSNDNGYIKPYCSSVYVIGDSRDETRHVISACKIEEYRRDFRDGSKPTLSVLPQPSDLPTVDRMFLQCTIGRVLKRLEDRSSLKSIEDAFLVQPDLLISASLRRS